MNVSCAPPLALILALTACSSQLSDFDTVEVSVHASDCVGASADCAQSIVRGVSFFHHGAGCQTLDPSTTSASFNGVPGEVDGGGADTLGSLPGCSPPSALFVEKLDHADSTGEGHIVVMDGDDKLRIDVADLGQTALLRPDGFDPAHVAASARFLFDVPHAEELSPQAQLLYDADNVAIDSLPFSVGEGSLEVDLTTATAGDYFLSVTADFTLPIDACEGGPACDAHGRTLWQRPVHLDAPERAP